jgi:hypothetical protein
VWQAPTCLIFAADTRGRDALPWHQKGNGLS